MDYGRYHLWDNNKMVKGGFVPIPMNLEHPNRCYRSSSGVLTRTVNGIWVGAKGDVLLLCRNKMGPFSLPQIQFLSIWIRVGKGIWEMCEYRSGLGTFRNLARNVMKILPLDCSKPDLVEYNNAEIFSARYRFCKLVNIWDWSTFGDSDTHFNPSGRECLVQLGWIREDISSSWRRSDIHMSILGPAYLLFFGIALTSDLENGDAKLVSTRSEMRLASSKGGLWSVIGVSSDRNTVSNMPLETQCSVTEWDPNTKIDLRTSAVNLNLGNSPFRHFPLMTQIRRIQGKGVIPMIEAKLKSGCEWPLEESELGLPLLCLCWFMSVRSDETHQSRLPKGRLIT